MMVTTILDVKGIGPSTAVLLAGRGIKTIQDLASATISELVSIPGFSEYRAAQVQFSARTLLKTLESTEEDAISATNESVADLEKDESPSVSAKEKGKKSKKDKKKPESEKKGKDKSKKKDKKDGKSKDKSKKKAKKKK